MTYRQRKSRSRTLANIATIVSSSITCIELAIQKIISPEFSAIIMVGVVFFVIMGNVLAKVALACIAVFIFAKLYSGGDTNQFNSILSMLMALFLVLLAIYIMVKGLFGRN